MVHAVWVVIALSAFAGVALAAVPTHASAAVTLDREEQAALDQLNVERTSRGLNALKVSPTLQVVSEWMASDMVRNWTTATVDPHTDSLGRSIRPRFTDLGYTPNSAIRENLAVGQATGREVVQGWMDSPSHRENNLSTDPTVVGIALIVRSGSTFTYYWALAFGSVDDSELVTPPPPAAVAITGSVPASGVALLQTGGSGTAEGVIAGLSQRGCSAASIWLVTGGAQTGYLAGAPSFVNAGFPASIAAGTPFIAVCR